MDVKAPVFTHLHSREKNMPPKRYRSFSSWLKERFGEPVRKITIDSGLGCPNRDGTLGIGGCIFCNATGSGTNAASKGLSVADQVERGIDFFSKRYKVRKFLAYFQSFTNTYGDPELLSRLYYSAVQRAEIVGLSVGTRPDCVSDEVLNILSDINRDKPVWLELGLQSIHDRTLRLIRRGHESRVFFDACERALKREMLISAHIILGLPGETIEDMILTAKAVAGSGIQGIKIHPLYVVAGSPLGRMLKTGEYTPMTMELAIEATMAVLEVLPKEMVIHRLTSDPHPEELVAPNWMLDRIKVRNHLTSQMKAKDVRQGSKAYNY